ncbi:MAG: DUF1566 domain-containing protein [Pseudomonadota bacterium]
MKLIKTSLMVLLALTGGASVATASEPWIVQSNVFFEGFEGENPRRLPFLGEVYDNPTGSLYDVETPLWDMPFQFQSDLYGSQVFANATGRVRNFLASGTRTQSPRATSWEVIQDWVGIYTRDSIENPTFTLNQRNLSVFAQTVGEGNLRRQGSAAASVPPFSRWRFAVNVSDLSGSEYTEVFEEIVELSGIEGNQEVPLTTKRLFNADRGFYTLIDGDIDYDVQPITEEICVPVPSPVNVQCFSSVIGVDVSASSVRREILLDRIGVDLGADFVIWYRLQVEVGEDASEHFAQAYLGDPLDLAAGGIELETTFPRVATLERPCDVNEDPGRFSVHVDGTVTDESTGLMWQRCPLGHTLDDRSTSELQDDLCVADSLDEQRTWQQALLDVAGSNLGDHSDWALPNVKALDSLVDTSCPLSLINTNVFPDTPRDAFWTSTPSMDGDDAWTVAFSQGGVQRVDKLSPLFVRAVREGSRPPLVPRIAVTIGDAVADESSSAQLRFPVRLTRPAEDDITIEFDVASITAEANVDFASLENTVTIPAGASFAELALSVIDDHLAEPDEALRIQLTGLEGEGYIASGTAIGLIVDDEPTVDIIPERTDVYEGDAGTQDVRFAVRLSEPASAAVDIAYSLVSDAAGIGSDVTNASSTVTIPTGEIETYGSVTVVGDTEIENDERFSIVVDSVAGPARVDSNRALITILDDDTRAALSAINDTGITYCGTTSNTLLSCPQTGFEGQDGEFGRDVATPSDDDGIAGFSFTKLDSGGVPLVNQDATYPYINVPPNPTQALWDCVRDENTGLVWEIKTDVPDSLRHYDWRYSWYRSDSVNDGGVPGSEDGGECAAGSNCDTESYIAAVNASNLCGYSDWRLPRPNELFDLAYIGALATNALRGLDARYFPHNYSTALTGNTGYTFWSDTSVSNVPEWAHALKYQGGLASQVLSSKDTALPVRLVRGDR